MGQVTGNNTSMHLVENVDAAKALKVSAGGTAPSTPLAYVTQTTLSVDDAAAIVGELKKRFPDIVGPKKDDICYATQNRQDAVRRLADSCDVIIVVGSSNSSNSNRLREVAVQHGVRAYLVDRAPEIEPAWFENARKVGITAGASAPESLVDEVVHAVANLTGAALPDIERQDEGVSFPLTVALAG